MIHNAMNMNASAYRRRAADAAPSTAIALGGMPGVGNRFEAAGSAIKHASSMLKIMQIGMTVVGGLSLTGSIVTAFTVGIGAAAGAALTGAVFIGTAWRVLPQFFGMIDDASKTVNALSAKEQLAQTGIPATARVIAMQPTGTLINHNPEVQTALEVQGPTGPYLVNTTAVINQMYIPQFQPGAMVNLRVSPQNPYDVAVVF
jgi:hypothetical protein